VVAPLPSLLAAYIYLSRFHAPDFSKQIASERQFADFLPVEKSLGKIGGDDLVNEMGFIDEQFTIPLNQTGFTFSVAGVRQALGGQRSYALVTTPMGKDGRVLVILSNESPARVTVFWMDKLLNGALIYDSFENRPRTSSFDDVAITSISNVRVMDGQYLELTETPPTGEGPSKVFELKLFPDPTLALKRAR
jgi:hypothetical protein